MIENSNKSNLKDEKYYKVVQFFFYIITLFLTFQKYVIRYVILYKL